MKMKKTCFFVFAFIMAMLLVTVSADNGVYEKLEYRIHDGEVSITGTTEDIVGEVIIPDTIDGYPVTGIDNNAFSFMEKLTSVRLPSMLKTMGDYVFIECTSLAEVTLPSGLTEMGDGVFEKCTSLKRVTLSPSLTAIYRWTFESCSIESIVIPKSVKFIEYGAFYNCTSLSNIVFNSNDIEMSYSCFEDTKWVNTPENWIDGVLYSGTYLLKADESLSGRYTVREGTRVICASAFSECDELSEIVLPEKLRSIQDGAFSGCNLISSVTVPSSVTDIGKYVFRGCDMLGTVVFKQPSVLSSLGSQAFKGCMALKSITLPQSLTSIGSECFSECTSLTSVSIPKNVTNVGEQAFYKCTSLKSVILQEGVVNVGLNAFEGCTALLEISIPHSLKTLGWSAFRGCTSLKKADLGKLGYVPESAFYGCSSLQEVVMPSVTGIDNYAFNGCRSLKKIDFSDDLEIIGYWAFIGCKGLEEVIFPEGLLILSNEAFRNCTSLKRVVFNDNLSEMGYGVFSSCSELESVEFGKNSKLSEIRASVFEDCASLKELYIPKTVKAINASAFLGCDELKNVIIDRESPYFMNGDYSSVLTNDGSQLVFCPKYLTEFHIPSEVKEIGRFAFAGCVLLESIDIPDNVTEISESAFRYCTALKDVSLSQNLVTIGKHAFLGCRALEKIVLPNGIKELEGSVFSECSSLVSVVMPESITKSDFYAFYKCPYPYIWGKEGTYAQKFASQNNYTSSFKEYPQGTAELKGVGLCLDGKIGVKSYVEISSELADELTVRVCVYNKTTGHVSEQRIITMPDGFYSDSDGYYFINYLTPYDTGNVEIRVTADSGFGYESLGSFTFDDYLSAFKRIAETDSAYADMLDLVYALEEYIHCVNAYFSKGGEVPAVEADMTYIEALPEPVKTGGVEGIEHISTSLLLSDGLGIRHYFKALDGFDLSRLSFTCNGKPLKITEYGDGFSVDITGISADEMGIGYTLTVNGTLFVTYSVLNYVKQAIAFNDSGLLSLTKALYNYWYYAK